METEKIRAGKIIYDSIEVIGFEEKEDGTKMAIISYQDISIGTDLNNYFEHRSVPVNERELQRSHRGNILVDQSVKNDSIAGK